MDKAATLLRMLHVKDLRQLQSLIDETIVKVQVGGKQQDCKTHCKIKVELETL